MADEYDPLDPPTYDAAEENYDPDEYENYGEQDDAPVDDNDADDDDDYDPSSFNYGNGDEAPTPAAGQSPYQEAPAEAAKPPPPKAKTRAGFIVDESDEEKDEDGVPPPSQLNGSVGAQSGLGAVAVSEAQDISLHSAPQDTVAESTSLNGSTTVPIPASASPVPDSLLQPSVTYQGKAVSPVPQVTPTPQPQADQALSAPSAAVPSSTKTNTNGALPAAPLQTPARLPHDKVGQLEDRIKDDPKGDTNAWTSLIDHYREKGQYDFARAVYERFFKVFPYAVSMWVKYIQLENELDETNRVVMILNENLMKVPNVQLWQLYLDHVRRALPLINDTDGQNRGQITAAFEATLDNVGIDPEAGFLWREYVDFLKDGPGTIGGQSWQDLQKVDLLRKAYQRSFKVPHSEFVKLWKEYELFERGLHSQTARKHITEQSPHYMQCRTAKMQLDQLVEGIDRTSLPRLPPIHGCAGEDEFGDQVEKWRAWIAWEINEDPLVYKGTEDEAYQKRVLYVYRQATMFLCFYPEIWFEAASWCFAQGGEKMVSEGEQFLERGIAANPESVLLALMKADRVESSLETGNTDDVLIRNGEKLDGPFENLHTALYGLRMKMQERDKRVIAQIQEHFANLSPTEPAPQEDEDDEAPTDNKPQGHEEEMKAQLDAVRTASAIQLEKLKRTISYVWVAKMQAYRRVQGQGKPTKKGEASKTVKGFRGIFSDSRPRGMLSSDVYIASALMEWNCYRDPSAIKIFERGMKLFPADETFVLEYIKHLIAGGDLTNARVVFESTVKKITDATDMPIEQKRIKCRRLLGYMHDHESKYGDLAQIHKVEKRMKELYPDEPDISRFSHRYALPEFDAIDIQLILSPTQAFPKALQPQSGLSQLSANGLDVPKPTTEAPEILLGPNGPYVASPKRPLEDSDNDTPQRKFIRAESPLKGAAGLRMQSKAANASSGNGGFSTKTFIPNSAPQPVGPTPLAPQIEGFLQVLPNAASYVGTRFDPVKLVAFLSGFNIDYGKAINARR